MSNSANKPASLEVVSANAEQSAAILTRCETRITKLNEQLAQGERLNEGIRFLIGAQMIVAKPHVPHGNKEGDGFQDWLKNKWPEIEYRTASNWMKFASTVLLVAPKQLKSETVSLFEKLPEHLANGGLNEKEQQGLLDLVPQVTRGMAMMDFIDEHAPRTPKGGARKISFHCPHCNTKNTGLFGREIKCAGEKCGKKITVKPDADPEAEMKRRTEAANDNAESISDRIVTAREESADDLHLLTAETRKRAIAEAKWWLARLTDSAKAKKARGGK